MSYRKRRAPRRQTPFFYAVLAMAAVVGCGDSGTTTGTGTTTSGTASTGTMMSSTGTDTTSSSTSTSSSMGGSGSTSGTSTGTMSSSSTSSSMSSTSSGMGGAPAVGKSASDFVGAGTAMKSSKYSLHFTMGQASIQQTNTTSPNYQLHGGLVGATENAP